MSAESLRILAGILSRPVDLFVLRFMRDDFTLSTFIYWNMNWYLTWNEHCYNCMFPGP